MPTLTIISHTEHYKNDNGTIVGLGPTITEINHLLDVFDEIIHVAMFHHTEAPSSSLPYNSDKITFIPIPALGGKTIASKVSILKAMPSVLKVVHSALAKSDYFQFRAPTGIGVFVIPYLILWSSKKGWFKYAGNWKQVKAPLSYRFQKWLLKTQKKRKVTINGIWNDQPEHCLSFENPCLTKKELEEGARIRAEKIKTQENLELCFVGRLEFEKGLDLLIKVIKTLLEEDKDKITMVHIVGEGDVSFYNELASEYSDKFTFYGALSREDVQAVYKRSHVIVLASKSEGFPKVIAEGLNFGCLPIASNLPVLSAYLKHGYNGFLLNELDEDCLKQIILKCTELSHDSYVDMLENSKSMLHKFIYSHYNNKLRDLVLYSNNKN